VPGDVASGEARAGLLAAFDAAFARIDALVNNAGVSAARRTDLLEMTEESFERVLGVNLRGPHFLCRDVARRMLAERRRRPADPLHMVNISSISEYAVSVYRGEYCIAKAGLGMVTQLYAQRLAAAGIQVNEIRPGIIATDMTAAVREKYDRLIAAGLTPMPRWGTPEDVAAAVAALLGGSFPFTTGAAFDVDGGFRIRSL
jgi:NAD(P)-dependent dehydrogenase (short-subunit alcohol dehydrogenase family)